MSTRKKKNGASAGKLRNLAKLISWLDGYAALRCVDPIKMERLAKSEGDSMDEVKRLWSDVREDVRDIASLPGSSTDIIKTSKYLNLSRIAITLMGVGIVVIFLLVSSFIPALTNTSVRLGILVVVAGGYYAVFFTYFLLSRRLNRLVADHYEKHQGEVAKQRKHIKAVTQKMIDVLAMRIRASSDGTPEKYKLKLLNDDYSNIKVLGPSGGRRQNEIIAVVKGRNASEK